LNDDALTDDFFWWVGLFSLLTDENLIVSFFVSFFFPPGGAPLFLRFQTPTFLKLCFFVRCTPIYSLRFMCFKKVQAKSLLSAFTKKFSSFPPSSRGETAAARAPLQRTHAPP
jgi:hypothetical protein